MQYQHLFQPLDIGPLKVKNRIVAAPTLPVLARPDGSPSRELIDFYEAKARGGAGVVTVGESAIDYEYAITHAGQINLGSDMMIPGLSLLAEAIKRHGAAASLELCHGGRQTLPEMIGGKTPIAPSPVPSRFHEMIGGRPIPVVEMNHDQIQSVIENFAAAAFRLKRAGFDMVMLHGGHGWMLAQWLSPFSNQRTDEYGGSLENRARFPLAVIRRVRERIGPDMAIEYRMSGDEMVPGGLTLEEAAKFARLIENDVDCIQVSAGMMGEPYTVPYFHPPSYLPPGPNVHLAEKIKAAVSIPVATVGAIVSPEQADDIIREGRADLVAMARALMADPAMPRKALSGRRDQIIPCTRCLECLGRVAVFIPLRCAVNPVTGRETRFASVPKAEQPKNVVVVGGGPAGLTAAQNAAKRGHRVTLLEKSDVLGGWVRPGSRPDFKEDLRTWLEYLIRTVSNSTVDVRMSQEATPERIKALAPDVLILAVGSQPASLAIPGIDSPRVAWAGEVYTSTVDIGPEVVIVGGGLVGCETALILARRGKQVTVVEAMDEPAVNMNPASRMMLLELLEKEKVTILTRTAAESVEADGLAVREQQGQNRLLPADTILMATGMKSRLADAQQWMQCAPEVHIIGDCLRPRKIINAVHEGFNAALEI